MNRLLQAAALIAALGAMPLPAAAQYGDGDWGRGHMGWSGPMMGGFGDFDGPMMGGGRRMGAFVETRLEEVKKEIEITAAQEDAWKAYADAVTARVKTMRDAHRNVRDSIEDGTAPDRIGARIAMMETHLEAMKAVKAAFDTLYAALDDKQKKRADDVVGFHGMM